MVKTDGIVFRSLKYRETSLIIDIYTKELGLRSYLVNGVRSSKSKNSGNILQAMSQLDLMVYDKHGADKLNRIKEFKLAKFYSKLPFDVIRSMIGQFMIEVLRNCIKDNEANYEIYEFIEDWFSFLDESPHSIANLIPLFLVELAGKIGFAFEKERKAGYETFDLQEGQFLQGGPGHRYYLDGNLSDILFLFIQSNKQEVHNLKLTNNQRSELIDQLIIYYRLHIESFRELRSLDILRSILA